MAQRNPLPLPKFYNAANAEKWSYRPNEQALLAEAAAWAKLHGIKPCGAQKSKVSLLIIDGQKDFCLPEGALFVAGRSGRGAIDDSARTAEFIYRNSDVITDITTTLDTHFLFQIFFTSFWLDANGNHPNPYTTILTTDIKEGKYRVNPQVAHILAGGGNASQVYTAISQQVRFYCEQLEKAGNYELFLWPFHCLSGTDGNALVGVIQEARAFLGLARGSQSYVEVKGGNPLTENYSVLRPEVLLRYDGQPIAQKNTKFFQNMVSSDAVILLGQASSHCVLSTGDDFVEEIMAVDPELARKFYVVTDCMSAVTIPDGKGGFVADYTPKAEAAYARWADKGMNLVKSTDPIESWPGIQL